MRLPLPATIKGLVTFIVVLSLLPALALLVYTGYGRLQSGVQALEKAALRAASGIIQRHTGLVEGTRLLLFNLSRLDAIQRLDAKEASILFQNLVLNTGNLSNIRLCLPDGSTLASANPLPVPLSAPGIAAMAEAEASPGFSVFAVPYCPINRTPALNCYYTGASANGARFVLVASIPVRVTPEEQAQIEKAHVESIHLVDFRQRVIFEYPSEGGEGRPAAELLARPWPAIAATASDYGVLRSDANKHVVFERFRSPDNERRNIVTVLGVSTEPIYQQMQEQLGAYALLLAASFAIAMVTTLALCNACLLEPLRKLLATASRLKAGRLAARVGASGMTRELRQLGDALDDMAASLEERDRELSLARDTADAANRAKTSFLATMSHEIRTPMNAIIGMSYLSTQGELTAQQKAYLDTIREEAGKLLVVINDILDFSKAEAGKLDMENVPFSIREVLESVREKGTEAALRKGSGFSLSFAANLPRTLSGDPTHLAQALSNLAVIAVRMADGDVVFICSFERLEAPAMALAITVSADRDGLPAEELAQLFFDGEEASRTERADYGMDLNIALTRKLITLMQGTIVAEPVADGKAVLRLSLPVTEVETARDAPRTRTEPEAAATDAPKKTAVPEKTEAPDKTDAAAEASLGRPLAGLKLLVADDNTVNLMVAEEILSAAGAAVATAGNGREALDMLRSAPDDAPYAAVLMDLQMPVMDGFAAAKNIRSDPRLKDIPVIAMTAQDKNEEWEQCLAAGMTAFASKPIDVPALLATLADVTGRRLPDSG